MPSISGPELVLLLALCVAAFGLICVISNGRQTFTSYLLVLLALLRKSTSIRIGVDLLRLRYLTSSLAPNL